MSRTTLTRFLTAMLVAALGVAVAPAVAGADGAAIEVGVSPATVQYSDYVTLKAKVVPARLAGSVAFTVDGASTALVGRPAYNPRTGVATQRYRALLAPDEYEIAATFTSADQLSTAAGHGPLTVRPEDVRVVFTTRGRPLPWLMPVTKTGRTAPFSTVVTFVEVPDGAPGDLSLATGVYVEQTMPLMTPPGTPGASRAAATAVGVYDHPDGLAPGAVFLVAAASGYYTGYGHHPYAVYDPRSGMSAGAGPIMNSTNGRPAAFTFVAAPQPSGPPRGSFIYQETRFTDGVLTGLLGIGYSLSSFTFLGANQVELVASAGDTVTLTTRDRRVARSADTIGVDWSTAQETGSDLADFAPTRLLGGAIDLRRMPPPKASPAPAGPELAAAPAAGWSQDVRFELPGGATQTAAGTTK